MSTMCARCFRGTWGMLTVAALGFAAAARAGTILTPAHVVVVVMEDRWSNSIGDTTNMPYTNGALSSGALIYSNSHGINTSAQQGEMNYLALYSGSAQGVTDDALNYTFTGPNLAQSLNNNGRSFIGYSQTLAANGDQSQITTGSGTVGGQSYTVDDLYTRNHNPMAMFSNVGAGKVNSDVNQTLSGFSTMANSGNFSALPTVSFVIPNQFGDTHGSNDANPFATDPSQYTPLRQAADNWLQTNLASYLAWAKANNSLLIVTGDEGDRANNFNNGFATIINGSSNLLVAGTNTANINEYNLLATIEDMYRLTRLGDAADPADTSGAQALYTNSSGQLAVPEPSCLAIGAVSGLLLLRRRRRDPRGAARRK
jgi:hypothetical protein